MEEDLLKPSDTSSSSGGPQYAYASHDQVRSDTTLDSVHNELQFSSYYSPSKSRRESESPPLGRINSTVTTTGGQIVSESLSVTISQASCHTDSGFSSWVGTAEHMRKLSPNPMRLGSDSRTSPSLSSLIEVPGDPIDAAVQHTSEESGTVTCCISDGLVNVMPVTEVVNAELSDTMFLCPPGDMTAGSAGVQHAGTFSNGQTGELGIAETTPQAVGIPDNIYRNQYEPWNDQISLPSNDGDNKNIHDSNFIAFRPICLLGSSTKTDSTPNGCEVGPPSSVSDSFLLFPSDEVPVISTVNTPVIHRPATTHENGVLSRGSHCWSCESNQRRCLSRGNLGTPVVSTSMELISTDEEADNSGHGDDEGDDEPHLQPAASSAIAFPRRPCVARRRQMRPYRRASCLCGKDAGDFECNIVNEMGSETQCAHHQQGLRSTVSRKICLRPIWQRRQLPQFPEPQVTQFAYTGRFESTITDTDHRNCLHSLPTPSPSQTSTVTSRLCSANQSCQTISPMPDVVPRLTINTGHKMLRPHHPQMPSSSGHSMLSSRPPASDLTGDDDCSDTLYWPNLRPSGNGPRCASVPLGRTDVAAVPTTIPGLPSYTHRLTTGDTSAFWTHHHALMPRRRGRLTSGSFCGHSRHHLSALARRIADVGDELATPCGRSLPSDRPSLANSGTDFASLWQLPQSGLASLVTAPLGYVQRLLRMATSSLSITSHNSDGVSEAAPLSSVAHRALSMHQNVPIIPVGRMRSNTLVSFIPTSNSTPRRERLFRPIGHQHRPTSTGTSSVTRNPETRPGSTENIFTFDHE